MTTPTTSPNVRILPREASLPADAPKSDNPLAEEALAELLQGGRLGIRDMYKRTEGENPEWDYADALRAGLGALDRHVADLEREGHAAVGEWWQGVRSRVWYGVPPLPPDPGAHPYPEAAPVAEPEPAADVPGPVDVMETWTPPQYAQGAAEKTYGPAPLPGEPERDPGEDALAGRAVADDEDAPATDAVAVLLEMAKPEEAAEEPDATKVMPAAEEETQIIAAAEETECHD